MINTILNKKNSGEEQLKVLIIDKCVAYGKKLTRSITGKTSTCVVGQAQSLSHGLSMFTDLNPDLIFMSTDLPDGNGIRALKNLKIIKAELKVIVVSDPLDNFTNRELKEANIDYFLDKSNGLEKIPAVINKLTQLYYA
jgi:two-component system nitrate/nitrite response regulator NarL